MLEESEISEHCFDLIFAFDEIVALGYRENVNLAQIRTFTEMDSHEEKVFRAVREVRSDCCLSVFLDKAKTVNHYGEIRSLQQFTVLCLVLFILLTVILLKIIS